MGQSSSSSGRRREDYNYPYPPPPSSRISSSHPPPPPPPSYPYSSRPRPNYSAPYPMPAPPPYPNPSSSSSSSYYQPPTGGYGRPAYYGSWHPPPSSSAAAMANPPPPPPPPPPPYVEHHNAKTVKNDVNVRKNTIQLLPDEQNPDQHLVSFTFDAEVDGSVTIYYFAKEGDNCSFSAVYPDSYTPRKVPFQKGLGQKFVQPSGSGIDFGFFDLDELSRIDGDVFPLVVYVEACPPPRLTGEQVGQLSAVANAQITLAAIDKNNNGSFKVKVLKQILWAEKERYELQEIYGIANSDKTEIGAPAEDTGKECVICMSEPRDTTVLPCRHMCMCSECAKALTRQSNKCPICRQPVEKLMEIKVSNAHQ